MWAGRGESANEDKDLDKMSLPSLGCFLPSRLGGLAFQTGADWETLTTCGGYVMANLLSSAVAGVQLTIWKEDQPLVPEEDGYLGKLSSGHVLITVEIGPDVPTVALAIAGRDEYRSIRAYPTLEEYLSMAQRPKVERNLAQLRRWEQSWEESRRPRPRRKKKGKAEDNPTTEEDVATSDLPSFPTYLEQARTRLEAALSQPISREQPRVYGKNCQIQANPKSGEPFVTYPDNLLCIAEVIREDGRQTNRARVWRIAVVSQGGNFFVTLQQGYEAACYANPADGVIAFPRFQKHPALNDLLVDLVPDGTHVPTLDEYQEDPAPHVTLTNGHDGVVTSFYDARGVGTILTKRGPARVYWGDCPERPRRRFLVAGERVQVRLDAPKMTKRSSSFELQAYDIRL